MGWSFVKVYPQSTFSQKTNPTAAATLEEQESPKEISFYFMCDLNNSFEAAPSKKPHAKGTPRQRRGSIVLLRKQQRAAEEQEEQEKEEQRQLRDKGACCIINAGYIGSPIPHYLLLLHVKSHL